MEQRFELTLSLPHLTTDSYKQKETSILISMISGSRLNENMRFVGYGQVSYDNDDKQYVHPIVDNITTEYKRGKSNCIVYSLPANQKNDDIFDTLFLFKSYAQKNAYYHYVVYNSKTKKQYHIPYIEDDYNELLKSFNKTFITLSNYVIYDYYNKKDIKTDNVTTYNDMINAHEAVWKKYNMVG